MTIVNHFTHTLFRNEYTPHKGRERVKTSVGSPGNALSRRNFASTVRLASLQRTNGSPEWTGVFRSGQSAVASHANSQIYKGRGQL